MILRAILKLSMLRYLLARIRFLDVYAVCLSISAKGFFYAWFVAFLASLPLRVLETILRLVDEHRVELGIHELVITCTLIFLSPLGILIGLTCIDCMIAGLRARNQFLLGSLFSSKAHDEKQNKLLQTIERAINKREQSNA